MVKVITLYYPTKGGNDGDSTDVTYKKITDFAYNPNTGIVSFKTQKHGTVQSNLLWRVKELSDDQFAALGQGGDEPAVVPAAAPRARRY
jgi:hypothetical protein